ncbi:MAG: amidohydrolase family protein, partial [Pyramidobacter sp.]|nr:amidohydrolase family protein [Pyramidobacter sp.]
YEPESKLAQGVTTEITGNCGMSVVPSTPETNAAISEYFFSELELPRHGLSIEGMHSLSDYAARVAAKGTAINYGLLVGHGTLRGAVMGFVDRDPSAAEMEQLEDRLEQELDAGAFGMSLGLIYPPSAFSKREELVELAKVLAAHDSLLTVHMRSEGPRIFEAVDEMIDITRKSGVHLEISHLKLMGKPQWGRSGELLAKIEAARAEGLNINCDQYPYTATSTSMTALLPGWAHDGGISELAKRVAAPTDELKSAAAKEMDNRGGPSCVMVSGTHGMHPEWEGKTVEQIAASFGCAPVDAVMRVLTSCNGSVACIYFCINESDMLNIMKDMRISVGSDGYGFSFDRAITATNPHPRSFGTFPRFLRIVREHALMPLEDAVYKMTGLPAAVLGLNDRGVIREGAAADLTVFDWNAVTDTSEFTDSVRAPRGIEHVIVNGAVALKGGVAQKTRTGGALLKK